MESRKMVLKNLFTEHSNTYICIYHICVWCIHTYVWCMYIYHIYIHIHIQWHAAAAKSLQSCPTPCDPIDGSPPGSPVPGILQAKNTGVACHFLLQCRKVKSESEVAQSCPTPSNPMDCSQPGSSIHGIFQVRVLMWGTIAFSACYLTIKIIKSCHS